MAFTSWTDALRDCPSISAQGRPPTVCMRAVTSLVHAFVGDQCTLAHQCPVVCWHIQETVPFAADTRILWKSTVFNDWDISVGEEVNLVRSSRAWPLFSGLTDPIPSKLLKESFDTGTRGSVWVRQWVRVQAQLLAEEPLAAGRQYREGQARAGVFMLVYLE